MPANRPSRTRPKPAAARPARPKLTVAYICADLGIATRTFYEWRAKGTGPECIPLPNRRLVVDPAEYDRWLAARKAA